MAGHFELSRRRLIQAAGVGGLALSSTAALAEQMIDLHVEGGASKRLLTDIFPQKTGVILLRTTPPWLETPFETFDKGVFTPNDKHFVSSHYSDFPNVPDLDAFRLTVRGHVETPLSLTIHDILNDFPRSEIAAVAQCAGNSRVYMQPRIAGAQWANGSMSNALWTGIPLRAVLDRAGVKAGAIQVRFAGMDNTILPESPKFMKSITVDHARDGEVMIAFGMNGEQLPLLNGFPIKLIVPGWCGVYWVKQLNDIEVLTEPDTNYWTSHAYRFPDTPNHTVKPGSTDFKLIPVTRNFPRSFVTNVKTGDTLPTGRPQELRGIAFGGDCGVAKVDLSLDQGKTWKPVELGKDEGKYGFRRWSTNLSLPKRGAYSVQVRCTNSNGEAQPNFPVWNPSGYMNNTIETISITAA